MTHRSPFSNCSFALLQTIVPGFLMLSLPVLESERIADY